MYGYGHRISGNEQDTRGSQVSIISHCSMMVNRCKIAFLHMRFLEMFPPKQITNIKAPMSTFCVALQRTGASYH